jgi:glutathione synthase
MRVRLGVVMDPIGSIKTYKDSTFAMLLEAQSRGWQIAYMEQSDLYLLDGVSRAHTHSLSVTDNENSWFEFGDSNDIALSELDVILMRKDPPFDSEYIYTTYLLELAEAAGTLVVNSPQGLRDFNEKLATAWFPQCCPPTLVAREAARVREFLKTQEDIILKPLGLMGGASVFRLTQTDPNIPVVIEQLTDHGRRFIMAQRYIPEIREGGDKRILLIDGEPVPWALARIPAAGETRGNLAAGGTGVGVELTERDRWICSEIADALRSKGLVFTGIDVIGDYLTEINITSPTCIRELDNIYNINIAGMLLDAIETRLQHAGTA